MAYKGRRVKKKPFYKKPAFWCGAIPIGLILVLILWAGIHLASGGLTIRRPGPTTLPASQERPTEATEETLPPPPENPYEPVDFDLDTETGEITLTSGNAMKGIDVSEWQGSIDWQQVKDAGGFLISILPILFVPTAVGILENWAMIQSDVISIFLLALLSTVVTFGIAGRITQSLRKKEDKDHAAA